MADSASKEQLIYLVVVGFHHSKGYQIEFCHPPMVDEDSSWMTQYLASIGLPDGAHNFDSDTVFFRFRNANDKPVWGVCSYKQVDSTSYKEIDPEVTRSAIQKSVCLVGSNFVNFEPAWRTIAAKLEPVAHAYIQHQDISILKGVYNSLCNVIGEHNDLLLEWRPLLRKYEVKMLTLIKLRLLQKKVLFMRCDRPTQPMCSEILVIESSIPCGPTCFPYITLSMMEDPVLENCKSFVGSSNQLYKERWRENFDAFVENGTILFVNKVLERTVAPTQADLRFVDWMQKTSRQSHCQWEGSEEWLRTKLTAYFDGLRLAVHLSGFESGEKLRAAYGSLFVTEVSRLTNVVQWLDQNLKDDKASENATEPGHPGSGQLSLNDVKLRLMTYFNNFTNRPNEND